MQILDDLKEIFPPSPYTAGGFGLAFASAAAPGALMMINDGVDPVHAVIGYGIGASLVAAGRGIAAPLLAVPGSASIAGGCTAAIAATLTNMHANHLALNEVAMGSMDMWPIAVANLIPLTIAFKQVSKEVYTYDDMGFVAGASLGALVGVVISASAGHTLATTSPEQAPIWKTENIRIIPAPHKEKPGNATIGGYTFSVPSAA